MTWVLGVNAPPVGWHDPAACLVDETGRVVAMAEEERFTRTKHGLHEQPLGAIAYCLQQAGITPAEVDVVAVGWDVPRVYADSAMRWGFGEPRTLLAALGLPDAGRTADVVFVPHHRAHAVSAYHASGLQDAAILVVDGNGEDESATLFEARAGRPMVRRRRWARASSLGILYAAVSETLGFGLLGAGKTMGLASFGRARDVAPWDLLDGELRPPFAHSESSSYDEVVNGWHKHIAKLLDGTPIGSDTEALHTDDHAVRLAWSAQATVERVMRELAGLARAETGIQDLCLAGGVALNCSANGLLPPPVHAPPIPHDAGVALGAAWSVTGCRATGPMSPYLGRDLVVDPATRALVTEPASARRVAELLMAGRIGALATGRSEVGPRALGHRSIVALPTSTEVRDRINRDKGRESWRPLAPVARLQDAGRFWHVLPELQRYMLGAAPVTPDARTQMPAAVHVDGTARAQIVEPSAGFLYEVLTELADAGVPPVVINTSLNTRGEPLVETAAEAVRAAAAIGLEFLVVGDGLIILP